MNAKDFSLENHGSICLVRPLTDAAKQWLDETAPEDAQRWCRALVVEPRYMQGVIEAITTAGFNL